MGQTAGEAIEGVNAARAGRVRSAVGAREAFAQELAKRSKTGGGSGHAGSILQAAKRRMRPTTTPWDSRPRVGMISA